MATMWRALARQGRILNQLRALRRQSMLQPACLISTSKKNKDVAVPVQPMEKSPELKRLEEHFADSNRDSDKNWSSYGWDSTNPEWDNFVHHVTMFFTVTICLCWGAFIIAYQPDHKNLSWVNREAFLELERREKAGLPLISPDYIDPSKVNLPSEDECCDCELIV